MPRSVDLQLLGWALLAGGLVGGVVHRVRHRPAGPLALLVAWLVALVGDRLVLDVLVRDLSAGPLAWAASAVVALLAARGAADVGSGGVAGPRLASILVLVSAGGIWLAVPETSVLLLVAGASVGAMAVGLVAHGSSSPGTAPTVVAGLAAAVAVGATGDRHALVGGLLCLATFAVVGVRPRAPGAIRSTYGVLAVLLHGASVVVAARQIGVGSSWGMVLLAGPAVLVLSILAAGMVRSPQRS